MTTAIRSRRLHAAVRQGFNCYYCGLPMWEDDPAGFASRHRLSPGQANLLRCTAEHLHARIDGGDNRQDNIVAACAYCNSHRHRARSALPPREYLVRVTRRMDRGKWLAGILPASLFRSRISGQNVGEVPNKRIELNARR